MFNPYTILAGLVFGIIGWGSFSYGRRLERWKPVAIGITLMAYPYFFTNPWLLWGIGSALLVTLWFHHGE